MLDKEQIKEAADQELFEIKLGLDVDLETYRITQAEYDHRIAEARELYRRVTGEEPQY